MKQYMQLILHHYTNQSHEFQLNYITPEMKPKFAYKQIFIIIFDLIKEGK